MADKKPVLEDTALCAIVRDEVINPAGGIVDFVHMTVPYVNKAVIVDTGSLDGTRELLEELQGVYSNLHVYDHEFRGFADARNRSLAEARKLGLKYALVLDADERLRAREFGVVGDFVGEVKHGSVYYFAIKGYYFNGVKRFQMEDAHHIRLFVNNPSRKFRYTIGENLRYLMKDKSHAISSKITYITHFLPKQDGLRKKGEWYSNSFYWHGNWGSKRVRKKIVSPSQTPGFKEWKALNPWREKVFGPIKNRVVEDAVLIG